MYIIGRGRTAREAYPDRGGGSSRGAAGSFTVVVGIISPDPPGVPPPPTDFLFALPNDNTLGPSGPPFGTGINYFWTFPDACTLTKVRLHGNATRLGTFNTLGAGGPTPHDVDLYIDGVFVSTLLTLPAGATDVDIPASPGIAIPAGAEVQFIIPVENNATGALDNFLFAFAIG